MNKTNSWKKWGAVAACFALAVIIGVVVWKSGLFDEKKDSVTLADGETIVFAETGMGVKYAELNLPMDARDLTTDEIKILFGDLPVTAYVCYDTVNLTALGVKGNYGDVKIVTAESDVWLVDMVIEGEGYTSVVDGVSINAGYFTPKENSKENKTVIYYASFKIGENTIYLENAGPEADCESIRNELADVIQNLIANGEFDLNQIPIYYVE